MRHSWVCLLTLGAVSFLGCSDDESSATSGAAATTTSTTGTGGSGGEATTSTTASSGGGGAGGMADAPPAAPAGLDATSQTGPDGVDLAWQASADADVTGYLVARSLSPFAAGAAGPVNGTTYAAGDALGGAEVIFVGAGLAFDDLAPGPGAGVENYYAAWAVDGAGQYSVAPATDSLDVPIPTQIGQIEIHSPTSAPTVVVTMDPLYAKLSGTAAYDAVTGLTLSLTVENRAARLVFNQKAILEGVSDPAAIVATDGKMPDGRQAAYYGPAGMDVAASAVRDLVLTGILGAVDPIVIDLEIASNAAVYAGEDYATAGLVLSDISGGSTTAGVLFGGSSVFDTIGFKPGTGSLRPGVFSPEGRLFYAGSRNMPYVTTVDMATMTAVAGTDLSKGATGVGFTSGVLMSPDGQFLYTTVTTGGHQFNGAGNSNPVLETGTRDLDFVKIDRATMTEVGRLSLLTDAAPVLDGENHFPKGAEPSITPDGARAVVPVHGNGMIWIVDLATMQFVDTDAATVGDQGIDVSATTAFLRVSAISPDGAKAYVGSNHGIEPIVVVDLATFATTTILSTSTAGQFGYGWGTLSFGPDGKLYVARAYANGPSAALSVYDPGTQSFLDLLDPGSNFRGVGFAPDGARFYVVDDTDLLHVFDTATSMQIDVDGDGANGISSYAIPPVDEGHAVGVTPF